MVYGICSLHEKCMISLSHLIKESNQTDIDFNMLFSIERD